MQPLSSMQMGARIQSTPLQQVSFHHMSLELSERMATSRQHDTSTWQLKSYVKDWWRKCSNIHTANRKAMASLTMLMDRVE